MLHSWIRGAAFGVALCIASTAHAQLTAVRVAFGLSEPVYLAAPAGDDRLFVVERRGTIRIVENGVVQSPAFLDITSAVNDEFAEAGMLGLAFAPDYATSGVFYVYYLGASESSPTNLRSIVSRFTVSGDPATSTDADEASEQPLFGLDQPYENHNGGTLAIRDGYLYLGLGDGGQGGDPQERAQDDGSLFGKLVRLDLSTPSPSNDDWEIWAKGLRNPYRFSFDRHTGDLYIGDVGQATQEEIDVVPADAAPGLNFGWDVMEGTLCFSDGPPDPGEPPCNDASLFDPTYVYEHPGEIPGAVVGGAVYRGGRSPAMYGTYFFADATRTLFFTMRWSAAGGLEAVDEITGEFTVDGGSLLQPVAIAEDGLGELHIVGRNGQIHRFVPEPGAAPGAVAAAIALAVRRGWRRAT